MEANETSSSVGEQQTEAIEALRPSPVADALETPSFSPALGIRSSHLQTVWGTLFSGRAQFSGTVQRKIRVPPDDFIVLHDDEPASWKRGQLVVLLLHGLSGCHGSAYMMRTAAKLNARNIRTFRMDHRGCGAGVGLASKPYHAGRIEDLHEAIDAVERLAPDSPIALVGFSLSGNLVLRYLGDLSRHHSHNLDRAIAVCPPIDLGFSVRELWKSRIGQQYDWYFTRRLLDQITQSSLWSDDAPLAKEKRMPRRLFDFDDLFTAPASGFSSADDYYRFASAKDWIDNIRVPTTILASLDDPLVSSEPLTEIGCPPDVRLCLTEHGGHLGYVGQAGIDPDRRWMDWRIVDWLLRVH